MPIRMTVLWVMAGGALGAGARYLLVDWSSRALGASHWGVMIANIAGSLLIGLIFGAAMARLSAPPKMLAFLTTGFLGGFTTFSTFSLDSFWLIGAEKVETAALYMLASVFGGLAAAALGFYAGRALFS